MGFWINIQFLNLLLAESYLKGPFFNQCPTKEEVFILNFHCYILRTEAQFLNLSERQPLAFWHLYSRCLQQTQRIDFLMLKHEIVCSQTIWEACSASFLLHQVDASKAAFSFCSWGIKILLPPPPVPPEWTFKSLNACNPSNCIDVSDKWVKSRKLLPSFQESLWHQTSLNCSHLIHYFFSWELLYCHLYFSFFLLSVLKWSKLELNLHSYKVDICTQTSWKNVLKWCHTKMVF